MSTTKFEEKKGCIISNGMDLMWDLGYNGTSVNDIVKAADVPKGSFYFYFQSKEDFAIQALKEYFKEMYGPVSQDLLHGEGSPLTRIKRFYHTRINMLEEHMEEGNRGCFACNLSSEVAEHMPGIQAEVARIHNQVLHDLNAIGKKAQEEGEIGKNVETDKMFAFLEDAGKGAMVSLKAVNDKSPIESLRYMVDRILS